MKNVFFKELRDIIVYILAWFIIIWVWFICVIPLIIKTTFDWFLNEESFNKTFKKVRDDFGL